MDPNTLVAARPLVLVTFLTYSMFDLILPVRTYGVRRGGPPSRRSVGRLSYSSGAHELSWESHRGARQGCSPRGEA